jgi:hypothetical protein
MTKSDIGQIQNQYNSEDFPWDGIREVIVAAVRVAVGAVQSLIHSLNVIKGPTSGMEAEEKEESEDDGYGTKIDSK